MVNSRISYMPCKSTCHQLPTAAAVCAHEPRCNITLAKPSTAFNDAYLGLGVDDCFVGLKRARFCPNNVSGTS